MENFDNISIKEIIEASSGKDESGFNKSAIGLFHELVDANGEVTKTVKEVDCDTAVLNVHKNYRRVFVDITFSSKVDVDLSLMNDLLRTAFDASNTISDTGEEFTLVTLSIIPHIYGGRYYMLCTDPLFWALTSNNPRGDLDTLRLVFDEDDFYVLAADDAALSEIATEVEAEFEAEERKSEFYEKQQERRRSRFGGPQTK